MKTVFLSIIMITAGAWTCAQGGDARQLALDLYSNNGFTELIALVDSIEEADSMEADSMEAELYRLRGLAAFELSRFDRALDDFIMVRELDSLNPGILYTIGRCYERLGRMKDAVRSYEDFLQIDPVHTATKVQLGNLYRSLGAYDTALGHFLDLVGTDSTNYYYYKQAGRCYQSLDSTDLALKYYHRANELNPYDLLMVTYMTNLYLRKKDLEAALSMANAGLAIDSTYTELIKLRGYVCYLREEYDRAIDDFMYLDATGQATKFVNKYLGLSCYKKKDYSMAFHYLSEAYKQDDQDPETTYFLANACRYSGREEEGVILLEKTVGLMMPDSADLRNVYIDLAELNNVLHRYNRAISYYQGAYALNPDDYLVFLFVAQIYDNGLKDYNNALSFYEGFLRYSREANKDSEDDPRIQAIYEYVEGRINSIREEQFFEQE